jgi:hypothetical protein
MRTVFILRVKYFAWLFFKALDNAGVCKVTYFSQWAGEEKRTAHAYAAVEIPVGNVHAEVVKVSCQERTC